jgi:alpha-glucosidase
VVITEADIAEYPGLWLNHSSGPQLDAVFPGYPLALLDEGKTYTRGKVTSYAAEIARTHGTREYPWRIFVVARSDAELLMNSMVYLLGRPNRIGDVAWVKPGVVTLDWWGRRNLFGVDFQGGVNTATARYMIDFAAHYGVEYFLLDEGWTKPDDLLVVHPDLNLEEVVVYARAKGIRVLLWAVWSTLERQWDEAFARFSRWGISGIKVDFMNRDDQAMVGFYHRVAEETARRKLLAIFHGAYKPDGLRRAYPNVITREGVLEFEQNAVNLDDSPEHHTLLPFIRGVAGPMDYLPGTIRNAQKHEFRMTPDRPMGQGTRAHTMALCVVLESPIRMLPDAPPDYYRENECTRFMVDIPVEWDELRVLEAKVGDSIALARRRGDDWYVAALTDWEPREMTLDLSFLAGDRVYSLTSFGDGKNAARRATDFVRTVSTVRSTDRLPIRLAPGGGWVARLSPVP